MARLRLQRRPSKTRRPKAKINRGSSRTPAPRARKIWGQVDIGPAKTVKVHKPEPTKQKTTPIQWDFKNSKPLR